MNGKKIINKMDQKNYEFSFEKLDVWKLSVELVKDIYKVTKNYPDEEKFGAKRWKC